MLIALVWVCPTFAGPEEAEYRSGIEHRQNAVRARAHFAKSAAICDDLWNRENVRKLAVARNRGRAHFLAGNLPHAIQAFRDGLAVYPWDGELQRGLSLARAAVAYPAEADPAVRVRPDPSRELRNRVSPFDLFVVAAISSALLAFGLGRRFTLRDRWAWPVAGLGLLGCLLVVAAWWQCDREGDRDRENPTVVIAADTVLRTGNGPSYPPRTEGTLPRGAEVRERLHRGGWVQVELPGGAVGWVPEAVVVPRMK